MKAFLVLCALVVAVIGGASIQSKSTTTPMLSKYDIGGCAGVTLDFTKYTPYELHGWPVYIQGVPCDETVTQQTADGRYVQVKEHAILVWVAPTDIDLGVDQDGIDKTLHDPCEISPEVPFLLPVPAEGAALSFHFLMVCNTRVYHGGAWYNAQGDISNVY